MDVMREFMEQFVARQSAAVEAAAARAAASNTALFERVEARQQQMDAQVQELRDMFEKRIAASRSRSATPPRTDAPEAS